MLFLDFLPCPVTLESGLDLGGRLLHIRVVEVDVDFVLLVSFTGSGFNHVFLLISVWDLLSIERCLVNRTVLMTIAALSTWKLCEMRCVGI